MKREDVRTLEEYAIYCKENPPDENAWIPFSTWSENAVKEVEEMMAERMRADPTRKTDEEIIQDYLTKTIGMNKRERKAVFYSYRPYWDRMDEKCIAYHNRPSVKPALDVIKHFADMFKEDFDIQDRLRELINAKNALPFNGGIIIYHHRQSRLLAVMQWQQDQNKKLEQNFVLTFKNVKAFYFTYERIFWYVHLTVKPYKDDFFISDSDRNKIANIDQYSGDERYQIEYLAEQLKKHEQQHAELFSPTIPKHLDDKDILSEGDFYTPLHLDRFQRRPDYKSKLESLYDPNDQDGSYKRIQKVVRRLDWHHQRRQNLIRHSNVTKRTVFDYEGYILPEDKAFFIEEFPDIYNQKPKNQGFNFEDRLGIPTSQRKSSNELQEIKSTVNELKTSIDEIKEHTEKTASNSKKNNSQTSESEQSTNNEQANKQIEVQKSEEQTQPSDLIDSLSDMMEVSLTNQRPKEKQIKGN